MNVGSKDQKGLTLIPSSLTVNQTLDMTLFFITDYVLARARSPKEGITMTITMKRKIVSEMMTTYFPSLLLMMITYATTFFKPFFFEAALSVNLTTMLVMTTIFISKMESLPPTSDIKMIDCWLILCQLVPFTQVVLLTAMDYLRGRAQKNEDKAERIKRRDKKRKRKEKKEKLEKNADLRQNITSAKNAYGGDLQIVVEDGIKQGESLEAWTAEKPNWINAGVVEKLMVIGGYLLTFKYI